MPYSQWLKSQPSPRLRAPLPAPELACRRCGTLDVVRLTRKGPHIGAFCAHCGAWVTWLPQKWYASQPPRPTPSPRQAPAPAPEPSQEARRRFFAEQQALADRLTLVLENDG